MLRKEEILSRTNNGLLVFQTLLTRGLACIGRHFLNPLYQDKKASCNIYFDRHSGMYKMKDFGNDNYSGDCFFFVGQLKELDCNRATDFVEILEIIDRDLGLGLASGTPVSIPRQPSAGQCRTNPKKHPKSQSSPTSSGNRSFRLPNWCTGNSTASRPNCWNVTKVCSLREYNSETAEGKPYTYTSSMAEPMYGYKGNSTSSCTARSPRPASSMAAASAKTTVSGWSNCPPKVTRSLSRAAKRCAFAGGTRFSRYLLQ